MNAERRLCCRIPVNYLAEVDHQKMISFATVTNISENGFGIRIPCVLKNKDIIKIKMKCFYSFGGNILEEFPLTFSAKVVWAKEEKQNCFLGGLQIMDTHSSDLHKLKNHLQILFLQSAMNQ